MGNNNDDTTGTGGLVGPGALVILALVLVARFMHACNAANERMEADFKAACERIEGAMYIGGRCRKPAADVLCDNSMGWTYWYIDGKCTRVIDSVRTE